MTDIQQPPASPPQIAPGLTNEQGRQGQTPGTQGQRDRLQACMAALQEILTTHRCQILPRFGEVIPVGTTGDTIQLKSTWDLGALPDQP